MLTNIKTWPRDKFLAVNLVAKGCVLGCYSLSVGAEADLVNCFVVFAGAVPGQQQEAADH